jgi:hypothetical protein
LQLPPAQELVPWLDIQHSFCVVNHGFVTRCPQSRCDNQQIQHLPPGVESVEKLFGRAVPPASQPPVGTSPGKEGQEQVVKDLAPPLDCGVD